MSFEERARQEEVDKFFDDLQGELLGFLLNMGLDPDDAEDILNECFLVIWQYWYSIRDSNPRAYLYEVARNLSRKLWRMRTRKPEDLMGDSAGNATVNPSVITVDFAQQVVDRQTMRWALQKLTARERETVLLRYYAGWSLAETARVMGVRTGTVKRYASEGLDKLYRALTGGSSAAARKEGKR